MSSFISEFQVLAGTMGKMQARKIVRLMRHALRNAAVPIVTVIGIGMALLIGGVVVTEDGDNPCSLLSIGRNGGTREIARDLADRGEWAGPCFNRSGNTLFASIQGDCTYAITGPFGSVLVT